MFVQSSLLDAGSPSVDPSFTELVRHDLDEWSWLEHQPSWISGSDSVFDELLEVLPWTRPEVTMYDRVLEQPRSTAGWALGSRFDLPFIDTMAAAISARYGVSIGSVWCNLYCDGNDSVAWHGDRVLRDRSDGLVVIVSVGHRRRFLIKPASGGPSRTFRARSRRPVRDGRRLSAPLAALRAEGVARIARRPAHQHHDAPRLTALHPGATSRMNVRSAAASASSDRQGIDSMSSSRPAAA